MAVLDLGGLNRAIETQKRVPVYLICSSEEYLLDTFAAKVLALAGEAGEEPTVIPGPQPDMGAAVAAAGAISLFGTRRLVYLRRIQPTAMSADDLRLLCELMEQSENAVLVLTVQLKEPDHRYGKATLPKAVQTLLSAAERYGVAASLEKPNENTAARFVQHRAGELNTTFERGAAEELVARCGVDLFALTGEVDKLAAASGYGVITGELVRRLSTRSIDADVFEMTRLLLEGKSRDAFALLEKLLYLRNEPIAIAAAMNSSFVDMVRVKTAAQQGIRLSDAAQQMGSKSDYRYKKSLETARNFSPRQLTAFLEVLDRLDQKLKGSAVDNAALLQTAMGEILLIKRGENSHAHS